MPGRPRIVDPSSEPALRRQALQGNEDAASVLARRALSSCRTFADFWRSLPGGRMTPELFRMFDRAWTKAQEEAITAEMDTVEIERPPA